MAEEILSVKSTFIDLFGNMEKVLHVKGSGWDLGTIEPEGHPAVNLEPLIKLRKLKKLSDEDMVAIQRQNLLNLIPKSICRNFTTCVYSRKIY